MLRRIKRINNTLRLLIAGIIFLTMASCANDCAYFHYESVPMQGWEKNDTIVFDVPHMVRPGEYVSTLGIRTTSAYPFMSLSLVVEQTVYPSGKHTVKTVECPLVSKEGERLAGGVSCYQYEIPAVMRTTLAPDDSLHYVVHHNMKRSVIPGILDVGMKLTRSVK